MSACPYCEHEVLFQRYILKGPEPADGAFALVHLAEDARQALFDRLGELETADLCVTISRRPVP